MKRDLNIWLDHDTTSEALDILFSVLKKAIKDERTKLIGENRYINVSQVTEEDLSLVKKISLELMIPIICKIEEKFSKNELKNIGFFILTIEGDCVDIDSDWNIINSFSEFLCDECKMPDEKKLPNPYYVSSKQIVRVKQDGAPDEQLLSKREIFHGHCGVIIVADRLKNILENLNINFTYAPVEPVPPKKLPYQYWAIHPSLAWGSRKNTVIKKLCPSCKQPLESSLNPKKQFERLWENRITIFAESLPDTDWFCSQTWQGNRKTEPFGFFRDIFISGRLYYVLLKAEIRGLMKPSDFLSLKNVVPKRSTSDAIRWIKSNLKHLE